ncbi:hypothetical protein [Chitinimonas sp.]|uniref:hypothetical protein n=1 Tax=Chitinimonas sp. TaxID=1934313 RepID=UPI002F922F22
MRAIGYGLLLGALAAPVLAKGVDVTLALQANNDLLLSYRLPEGCQRLPFVNPGALAQAAGKVRKAWQALDDCSQASGEAVSLAKASCSVARFKVPPSTEPVDRVYPGSFPMGGGVYAHTWNYAVADSCGPVRYHFTAPGSVSARGKVYAGTPGFTAEDATAGEMPALLLQQPLKQEAGATVYLDPALGEATIAQIHRMSTDAVSYFSKVLPHAGYRQPVLAATRVAGNDGGQPRYWGDGQDVLRLALYNWPDRPQGELVTVLNGFVAHEYAHRFQPLEQHDVYSGGDQMLHEGSAELLQWLAGVETGWRSKADSATMLDEALAACLQQVGDKPWQAVPLNRRNSASTIYPCGLVTQLFSLAARQIKQPATAQIDRYFAAGQQGGPTDMAQAFECGDKADCQPRWLQRLMGGKEPMAEVWAELASQTGLLKQVAPSERQSRQMLPYAFAALMQADCGGATSFYPQLDGFMVAAITVCQNLREGMYLKAVEGQPLSDAVASLPLLTGCRERGSVSLQDKEGKTVTLSCKQPFNAPTQVYAVDMERLLASLR